MSENLTATPISGNIYQLTNAAETENRFPITVIEAVLGLSSYLQQQFSNLSTLYMGINDVALSGTMLTVKGTSVNLATVTDLSNYYTKTETDGRYLQLTGGAMSNTNLVTNLNADLLDGSHLSDILAMDITGNAKTATNAKSELKTGQEFVFRKTNVEWDAKSGVIKKIKGKTLAWNQLVVQNPVSLGGLSITHNSDGSFTINGTSSAVWPAITFCPAETGREGHKIYMSIRKISGNITPGGDTSPFLLEDQTSSSGIILNTGGDIIFTKTGSSFQVGIFGNVGDIYDNYRCFVTCCDLTILFNGNVPENYTVADFERDFPELYYPQNDGTLISNDAEAVETTGANQWDEEADGGYWYDMAGIKQPASKVCCRNLIPVIPGKTYYYTSPVDCNWVLYGADKQTVVGIYMGGDDSDFDKTHPRGSGPIIWSNGSAWLIPDDCHYLSFSTFGSSYTEPSQIIGQFCINISNQAIDGQYFPYKKSRINLGLKNIKVVSPNVWDEEWEVGGLDTTDGSLVPNQDRIRSKEFIPILPSTAYYRNVAVVVYYYDGDKNYIDYNASSGEFTTPSNAKFLKFRTDSSYGTTYNHDITINKSDTAFNGRYFPYGTLELEGGLKGAGSAYDEIRDGKKHHKRMGRVDLGSLTYRVDSNNVFRGTLSDVKKSASSGSVANIISSNYVKTYPVAVNSDDKTIAIDETDPLVAIHDSAYSDPATFKAAMQGVMLDYELQYEEVYDLAEPLPSVYPCDQFGTERVISPVSTTPSTPFLADIQYGAKSDDIANDLIGTRDAVQPLLDALQYDGQNHAWHLKGNIYADGFVTAGGINSGATPIVIAPVVYEVDNWTGTVGKTESTTWSQIAAKYGQGYNVQIDNTDGALYSVIGDNGDGTLYLSGGCTLIVDTE